MSGNTFEKLTYSPLFGGSPFAKDKSKVSTTTTQSPSWAEGVDVGGLAATAAEERKRIAAQKAQILSGTTNTNSVNTGAI